MRGAIGINLASEPFRRDRPFVVACITAAALLTGLLVYQLSLGWIERDQRRELQASIDKMSARLAAVGGEQARLAGELRKPENADTFDYAVFLNGLLLRKGISWTRIFSDLEQVMPHNVRLIAVRPQVNTDNQVQLDMTVGAQTPPPVVSMLSNLERSPRFGRTLVVTLAPPTQSDPLYRYRVTVNYAPQL